MKEKIVQGQVDDFDKKEFAKEFTARMRREKRERYQRRKQRIIQQDAVLMQMMQNRTEEVQRNLPDQAPPIPSRVRREIQKREQSTGIETEELEELQFTNSGRQLMPMSEQGERSPMKSARSISVDSGKQGLADKIQASMEQDLDSGLQGRQLVPPSDNEVFMHTHKCLHVFHSHSTICFIVYRILKKRELIMNTM